MEAESELRSKIEETVLRILESADMQEMTEHKVCKIASEKLSIDLSVSERKRFVRQVVEAFLKDQQAKVAADDEEEAKEKEEGQTKKKKEKEEEEEEDDKRCSDGKEYDDGDLIICRLSTKWRITITDFRGKTLVSIWEYYYQDGKELPTSKGISLTAGNIQ